MKIRSSVRDYEVQFQDSFEECLRSVASTSNLCTLVDSRVLELYRSVIEKHLPKPLFAIDALEENKSFDQIGSCIVGLLENGIRKNTHLLVIGGGILQDIGGFVASVVFRGVEWTLIPTTLLAQCDSCIGSKTSVNIAKFKNQLGTFCPPKRVLVSANVLNTLKSEDLQSGVCEGLKLAMIESASAVERMVSVLSNGLEEKSLRQVVHQSLEIKKKYIEEDEFDRGRRNLLNYGHTFAHVFESATNYAIPHGIAVGLGIEAATYFSSELGYVAKDHFQVVRDFFAPLTKAFRSNLVPLKASELVQLMKSDKKNTSADITFILTRGFGKMFKCPLSREQSEQLLISFLQSLDSRSKVLALGANSDL